MPDDLKKIKRISKDEIKAVLSKFSRMSREDLKHHLDSKKATMLDLMVGSVMHQAVKKGDHYRLDFLFNRLVGKVKDEPSDPGNNVIPLAYVPKSQRDKAAGDE